MSAPLLRFAIIADTHIEPEGDPTPRSNRRARRAVEIINHAAPAFTVHLGDVVHPVPGSGARSAALDAAGSILAGLDGPLHVTPGNHDVGDKRLPWMPAKTVRPAWVEEFRGRWTGPRVVEAAGIRVVLVDGPVLGSGLDLEREERDVVEQALRDGAGRRFVLTHYPPFLVRPGEADHYDNVAATARPWLLGLCDEHGVEAVIAGHVHTRFRHRLGPTSFHTAPATAFARRDYSELFAVGPAPEFGRDDAAKLGVLIVEVLPLGHRLRFRRLDEPDGVLDAACNHRLGVALRHPWAGTVEVPANPPTDALQRREARDDHPLLAIGELGLGVLRVPAQDLLDPATREGMRLLAADGCRFLVTGYGLPDQRLAAALETDAEMVLAYEVVARPDELEALRARAGRPPVELRLAPLSSSADLEGGRGQASQRVAFGFRPDEIDGVTTLDLKRDEVFGGVVARIGPEMPVFQTLLRIVPAVSARELTLSAGLEELGATPETAVHDEAHLAGRAMEAAFAAQALPDAEVVLDSLADIDRGYYPRLGLIDRRGDLRPAGRAVRAVNALPPLRAGGAAWTLEREGGLVHGYESDDGIECLVASLPTGTLPLPVTPPAEGGQAVVIRKDGVAETGRSWTAAPGGVRIDPPLPRKTPYLVRLAVA